jgi:citrate lyase alpha subunit
VDVVLKRLRTSSDSFWHHSSPLVEEIVKGVLLDVVAQPRFELRRNLFLEAVVEELAHAPVQMRLHAAQAVVLVGIDLEEWF